MTTTIRAWLDGIGLSQYADAFEANDLEHDLLAHVDDAVLKDIGVASVGHRLRILAAIRAREGLPGEGPGQRTTSQRNEANHGERRQATVLAADLTGYTALCARLDAEHVQTLIGRFYEAADRIVAAYGGHVIDHAGDGTLAAFGAPVAHDNDGERAVRAALEMHAAVGAIIDDTGHPLRLHVGIASGEVVAATIAGGAQPKYAVTGDAVNRASRLDALAESGQTLVDAAVWHDVSSRFAAEALGAVSLKGIDAPVQVWAISGTRHDEAEGHPLVGRRVELQQLLDLLDSVQAGAGRAACVRGDAGIGKSRLVEELRRRAEAAGFSCHTVFVLDFGLARGQVAIPALVKDLLGAGGGADDARVDDAVERGLADGLLRADESALVKHLLELPQSTGERSAIEAMDRITREQRLGECAAGLLHRAAQARPRLLVIEDVHWSTPPLLRMLALLTRAIAGSRVALVMTSRFEGYPLDARWRAHAHGSALTTIELAPLGHDDSRLLAASLMPGRDDVTARCIDRAEGNPLFLRQLLRDAAEVRMGAVPPTIQSVVLARMDRLDPRDKHGLQAASVLGKRFDGDALQHLMQDGEYECTPLIDADLVRPHGPGFVFAHALIHEGVYASLLNARKRELHKRAADWYGEREPVLRAEHLDRAGDRAAGAAYLAAAQLQAERFQHESALDLVERGVRVAHEETSRCSLLLLRGELLRDAGRSDESLESFRSALPLCADDGQRYLAWMGAAAAHRVRTDLPAAMAAVGEAEAFAERLDLPRERSRVHHLRGNLYFAAGDGPACRAEHEIALRHAERAGDVECEAQAFGGLGDAEYLQGRMRDALAAFERCVALCDRGRLPKIAIPGRVMVAHCASYLHPLAVSVAGMRRALEQARRIGQVQFEIFARQSLGLVLATRGDYEAAVGELQIGVPIARQAGARRFLSAMLYSLALARLAGGQGEEARALLDEAYVLAEQTGFAFAGPLVLGAMAVAADPWVEASRRLEQGEAVLRTPCISHCHLHFRRHAIDACLAHREWDEALRHARALESYVSDQPLPWATLVIDRARLLAARGRGACDDGVRDGLRQVREEAARLGMLSLLPAVDEALAA